MNRSSSPIPPESGGGSGTLSNNALYAPLSTYVDDKNSSNNSRHSLSLQTTSSLRESSLITFLTTMSTNLKTTTRSCGECSIYRKLGGSISHHGMGDSDRAERSLRSMFESKLSNRSLVLVGGGIHSSMNYTTLNNRGHNLNNMAAAAVTTATTTTTTLMQNTACGKRQRKRVGGNGIFGSISNKRRKRILKQKQASLQKIIELERTHDAQRTQKDDSRGEQIVCVPGNHKSDATSGEDANQQQRNAQQQQQQQQQHHQLQQQQTSSVIETIHNKWSNYINQLLTMTMKNDNTNKDINTITTATVYERISHLLATSEHVGMAVTIVKCNSRRHLLNSRCIVIDETKETWKMAMLVATKKKKNKRKNKKEKDDGSKEEKWSIIMVPKRGTTLEINVPWNESSLLSNKSAITSKETINNIIVRLEN